MSDNVRMFCSDLDGTLVGNPESTARFRRAWEGIPPEERPILCYSSGRLLDDAFNCIAQARLPKSDYVISGVGTGIYDVGAGNPLPEFSRTFESEWDRDAIERFMCEVPGIERQPEEYQHRYKSSWYLTGADTGTIEWIEKELDQMGLHVHVVYSSMRDLDVLPARADKGNALAWLCNHLGVDTGELLVAGDTGNDAGMFLLPGIRGIVVGNAQPELFEALVKTPVYISEKVLAEGVLDGLLHFGIIPEIPSTLTSVADNGAFTPSMTMLFDPSALVTLTPAERDLIALGYDKALAALRKTITPLGFAACSLEDNSVTGTDVNYRSIWARDGSITVISTMPVDAPDIRTAQRETLRTLFEHISPSGQIPANVRIETGEPDYAGVGGICSIDSGLWAVIAFYHYVKATGEIDLLHHYAEQLQQVMNWLSAHDSNNDGLLEIPEAGDWTDLFGRSYNVLYDEVLWYRTNVCFGLLLEMLGDTERAADYLRWAKQIKSVLLGRFWPSTKPSQDLQPTATFADRQYSIGDASYLLAEITPFSFNWRCDVYGNILAFLCNVLNVERARTAFTFMWGVGVNEPYPVTNLYPTVQSGDPDWRPYYTVNLLNLPHHYHNGGVWPFIGGMWVRFIHRLGLHDVAARELLKLAELNRLGIREDWEFNEWAHGRTGRPMGKRFQAWSAASYIRACLDLQLTPEKLNGSNEIYD